MLDRLSPASAVEALGRPAFLYDQALSDPASAVALAAREQARLLQRLPQLLDEMRGEAMPGAASPSLLLAGAAELEVRLDDFLARLLAQAPTGALLLQAVQLNARTRLLRDLRLATAEFAADAAAAAGAAPMPQLTEALHLLLSQLAGMADAEDAAMLQQLTGDRGAMMQRMRAAGNDPGAPVPAALLHRATALFERAVWLIRSLAVADPPR